MRICPISFVILIALQYLKVLKQVIKISNYKENHDFKYVVENVPLVSSKDILLIAGLIFFEKRPVMND